MSLKIVAPGERRNNACYMFLGRVAGKGPFEIRTKLLPGTPRATVKRALEDAEREIRNRIAAAAEEAARPKRLTFAEAADRYIEQKGLRQAEIARIDRILGRGYEGQGRYRRRAKSGTALAGMYVDAITLQDILSAAQEMLPGTTASTKNREVITPARAILRHAEENNDCKHLKIRGFSTPKKPVRRAVDDLVVPEILAAPFAVKRLKGDQPMMHLLLTWLLCQGNRISEAVGMGGPDGDPRLGIRWEQIDLDREIVRDVYIGKNDMTKSHALDPEVVALLRAIPAEKRTGRLFPWRTKSGVYKWLRPLMRDLGIKFTPHMARHTLAAQLKAAGVTVQNIMDVLNHKDVRSSLHYQGDGTIEVERSSLLARRPSGHPDKAARA